MPAILPHRQVTACGIVFHVFYVHHIHKCTKNCCKQQLMKCFSYHKKLNWVLLLLRFRRTGRAYCYSYILYQRLVSYLWGNGISGHSDKINPAKYKCSCCAYAIGKPVHQVVGPAFCPILLYQFCTIAKTTGK